MALPLNHKILGQGPPVIILHGLFGMLDNLLPLAKKIEDSGYMVILIDQRNHGRSPHSDEMNYMLMSEDVAQFMNDNWIHEAIIIGHSMGGKTALQLTANHESMVSKLVVIDIGIKKYQHGHHDVFDALFDVDLSTIESRSDVQDILMSKLNHLGTVQFLMKNLSRNPEGGFEWKANLKALHLQYENIVDGIKWDHPCDTETLFIKGEKSPYILEEDKADIQNVLPNSRFSTIADAGHWVHVDAPDELFNQIIDFI